jgi:putative membrane-bound dehydrogenase-like protein
MFRFVAILFLTSALAAGEPAKPLGTHQIQLDGQTFTLPVGFTIERVAGPPLVDRPIVASFDDRGRLYVADSSGSNEKPEVQLKNPTHRIIRLEDTKGTGVFDKATVFADKMMFPEGILWHRGSVYVGAPPHIWKLTDTDDDGKADKREIWFDGKTVTGCANDLHGPYLGPDGWIYWCKGAFAKQEYTLPNGKKFTTRASHIFRARPDGTGIEPVMTGGMDNPVGIAFLPNGERFFTTTFFQHPAAGQRDGIIHAIYGGIYGKDHDVIYDPDHKWTSPQVMPVMTHLGPAAPCGLHCYESNAFGEEYKSNLFACQFNLRKVSRHVLKPHGSTYTTEDSDFLVSDNQDFHPTDVIEDADGSLLVVNTGGWYKLCCPSSQLVKADVLGAIYRVRKKSVPFEPRRTKRMPETQDPFKAVLQRWSETWTEKTHAAEVVKKVFMLPPEQQFRFFAANLPSISSVELGCSAVWALCAIDRPEARELARSMFGHANDIVSIAAIHSASIWRDKDAVSQLVAMLKLRSPIVRRAAAEALGHIGDDRAVGPILKSLADEKNDRALDHSLTYALIELDNREYLKSSLTNEIPRVRRACLTALDQLGEKLDPKVVLEAMKSKDAALKETGLWIMGRHPEWASAFSDLVRDFDNQSADVLPVLQRFARTPAIEKVLLDVLLDPRPPDEKSDQPKEAALAVMKGAPIRELPANWATAIGKAMQAGDPGFGIQAIKTLRAFPPLKSGPPELTAALKAVIEHEEMIAPVRFAAMAVFPGGFKDMTDKQYRLLLDSINHEEDARERGPAVDALALAKLSNAQLADLIRVLPKVSPLDLDRVLGAFAQTKDEAVGLKLVAALNDTALRSSLRADGVKERIKHFGPAVHKEAEKLYVLLNADYEKQKVALDEYVKNLKPGDIRRGQAVFNSTKTSCIACHTVGYVGGKQGPDLTKIGSIRNERDLLESILFPSASFVRSYEPLTVRTKDGKTYNGVPKKDSPEEIVLVLAADKEQRIPREDIEDVQPGKVSIMPAGLDKQLSPQELADLIAFLKNCK